MDLEVVGRHALLFDDDNSASFVNSPDALVEWNSLLIDRYDVRHLLPTPLPPRTRRRHPHPDASLDSVLDLERYHDLPSPSNEEEYKEHKVPCPKDTNAGNDADLPNTGGYHSVAFAYGNPDESREQKNNDAEPVFRPAFLVPESLIQNLPPTEKIHQIIARTATFVAKNGGQSEIVLRVKQGDNPMFGFLMPDHHLHAYFRFLVDHQELLKRDTNGFFVQEEKKNIGVLDQTGGALSLLGSVYGSGEDEDDTAEDASDLQKMNSHEAVNAISATVHGSEQKESTGNATGKNDIISKSLCPSEEKVNLIKRNRITSTVKGAATSGMKKVSDASGVLPTAANKSQAPPLPSGLKVELPILEPPSDQRTVVEKIVEFILKNGREFEAILAEQNCKQGRFLFLLPSNQYHPYYVKVLQDAQESKLQGKHSVSEKQKLAGYVVDKKGSEVSSGSASHEIPFDHDRKEKFKMVIGKLKKDGHDLPSKSNHPEVGVSVDAVAAILQAATRGIKNPDLDIFPKRSSSGVGQGSSNDVGRDLSSGSQKANLSSGVAQVSKVPVPVAKAIAETAALAAASEADSSEASFTKEQKLKAERLKRAKMFAAMLKGGSAPLKTESLRGVSVEPPESGVLSSGNLVLNLATKEREGSSAPVEVNLLNKVEYDKKISADECNERRQKKTYRTLSKRVEEEEEEDSESDDDKDKVTNGEDKKGHKHSKKRRSHHSSDNGKDRHRHKRHSSSKDRDSRHRRKHEHSDERHRHSRSKHNNNSSDDEHQPAKRHRHHSSSDDDHWRSEHQHTHSEHRTSRSRHHSDSSDDQHRHSRHRHNRSSSSKDEHWHRRKASKHREPESEEDVEIEEGEILLKPDQPIASGAGNASREASVDILKSDETGRAPSQSSGATVVSDDLRAKIRAMLMATL